MAALHAAGATARPGAGRALYGEGDQSKKYDEQKLRIALAKEEASQRKSSSAASGAGGGAGSTAELDRKRKYNSLGSCEVTEEEMEAYRMKKTRGADDPMANMLQSNELLPRDCGK